MSSTRRVGTPSASWVAAPNASASGRVVDEGDAGAGDLLALATDEQRTALDDRLAPSALPTSASTERVTSGSSTTGRRGRRDLLRPEQADRPLGGVVRRDLRRRARRSARPAEKPLPVWVSVPSPAIAYAENEHIVRRVAASTPSEFATAASTAASP